MLEHGTEGFEIRERPQFATVPKRALGIPVDGLTRGGDTAGAKRAANRGRGGERTDRLLALPLVNGTIGTVRECKRATESIRGF